MSSAPSNIPETKMLPGGSSSAPIASPPIPTSVEIVPARTPARQLHELPKDELKTLAEEFGLDPSRFQSTQHLVAAVHERDRKSTRLNSSHMSISYAVFCLKKKNKKAGACVQQKKKKRAKKR